MKDPALDDLEGKLVRKKITASVMPMAQVFDMIDNHIRKSTLKQISAYFLSRIAPALSDS